VAAVVAAVVAASAWSPPIGAAPTTPSGAVTASTPYYLALGDSLAAGTGASTTATRYVDVLATHEAARFPGLQLVDLACGGATTTSVINGPGCSYTTGTQLGDAEAFLRAHPGHVPFVTIDIGANDVDGCLSGSTVNPGCVQSGLAHICTDLPQILAGLDAAYPGLVVYGMDYYDPFLGLWITGPTGQTLAQQSEALALSLNGQLAQIYAAGGVATADPATLFQTSDFAPTGSYLGVTEPQNVADVCNWTLFCSGGGNIHANDIGHGLVAQAFEQVVDNLSVVTAALPEAVRGTTYGPVPLAAAGLGVSDGPFLTTLTWTKVALPRGLHLSRAGILSGVPGRHLAAGPTSVTVRVTETVTTVSGRVTTRTKTTVQSAIPLTLT
jgi:lysophospholipase L1-like esterase